MHRVLAILMIDKLLLAMENTYKCGRINLHDLEGADIIYHIAILVKNTIYSIFRTGITAIVIRYVKENFVQ